MTISKSCPCGFHATSRFCPQCGRELRVVSKASPWPTVGQRLDNLDPPLTLRARCPAPMGARRLRADAGARRFDVFITPPSDPEGALVERQRARAKLGERLLPSVSQDHEGLIYEITELPKGQSLRALLEANVEAPREALMGLLTRVFRPLLGLFAELHAQGAFLGGLDPDDIFFMEGEAAEGPLEVALLAPPRVHVEGAQASARPKLRQTTPGFSAPELYGRCRGGLIDARADVFALGMVLYYILAQRPTLFEAGDCQRRLPSPRVYADAPPDLVAVCQRATASLPLRRFADARALFEAFELALTVTDARRRGCSLPLKLDIGHELHIGLLKGQFTPQNQDDMFLGWQEDARLGLFLISDGVSISDYGSGEIASGAVRLEASRTWARLMGEEAPAKPPPSIATLEDRARVLRRMLNRANHRIAALLHQEIPRFIGPPEGIMAATAVVGLLKDNTITLAALGDSRIYLVRDGYIVSLMPEHNFATQLMQMGQPPAIARQVQGANALVRCVGEFEKGEGDRLKPVLLQPEILHLNLLPGDTLIFCSDGVPDYAAWDEEEAEARICAEVEEADDALTAAFELMVLANRGGGGDNISCIVLRCYTEERRA
ncbi:SpoIIE family protein phosphatase [Myxococcota bacterium]|nr:SpoIIE family protein phosphatase [Myxococcota bacterium]MBU1430120.1 SpoIIE family protein phosphatase [Myxococcota bacterium]MBU1900569.1 SpoIIE family protein phosphatase [Myxococcota bacterium]